MSQNNKRRTAQRVEALVSPMSHVPSISDSVLRRWNEQLPVVLPLSRQECPINSRERQYSRGMAHRQRSIRNDRATLSMCRLTATNSGVVRVFVPGDRLRSEIDDCLLMLNVDGFCLNCPFSSAIDEESTRTAQRNVHMLLFGQRQRICKRTTNRREANDFPGTSHS